MKARWAVRVAYLASEQYHGYQKQPNKLTIEGILEEAFAKAEVPASFGTKTFVSSGRTDRLVSALRQTISFDLPEDETTCLMRINSHLPRHVRLWSKALVPPDFHPRFHALFREYHYFLPTIPGQEGLLNLKKMRECLDLLKGTHDFQNFSKTEKSARQNTIRTLDEASIIQSSSWFIVFRFRSRGFLWQQVRRMVSHVIQVGLEKISLDITRDLLTHKKEEINPKFIPSPAPPEGLILSDVHYGPKIRFETDLSSVKDFLQKMNKHFQQIMMKSQVSRFAMTMMTQEMQKPMIK